MLFKYNTEKFRKLKGKMFPDRNETILDFIKRREKIFYDIFFIKYNIRLMGNPENPALVYKDKYILSGFLSGFTLVIFDYPFSENKVIYKYQLDSNEFDSSEFESALLSSYHRSIFKLRITDSDLYVSGRNYKNWELKEGEYPVFSKEEPIVYMYKHSAIHDQIKYNDYSLKLVYSDGYGNEVEDTHIETNEVVDDIDKSIFKNSELFKTIIKTKELYFVPINNSEHVHSLHYDMLNNQREYSISLIGDDVVEITTNTATVPFIVFRKNNNILKIKKL